MPTKKTSFISDIRRHQGRVVDLAPAKAEPEPRKYFSKRIAVLLALVAIALSCSPYTITRLVTSAEDDFSFVGSSEEYARMEEELEGLKITEAEVLGELAVLESKENSSSEEESSAPAFDPAIAPTKVILKISLENGEAPDFSVRAYFVAVGGKRFEAEMDGSGQISTNLNMGRYNAELEIENKEYRLKGDAPAFVIPANDERDLGVVYLKKK